MPGKGTTGAIFTVRQMQEKYGCKGKKLYFAFVARVKGLCHWPSITEWEMYIMLRAPVSEMTCTVLSGTLNSITPYHTFAFVDFPGETGLVSCSLNSPSPLIPELQILSGQASLSD